MSASGTSFTLTEAAEVTGRSRVTMRRYLDAGKFPNAFRDVAAGEGPAPWRIPATDLVSVGMTIGGEGKPSRRSGSDTGHVSVGAAADAGGDTEVAWRLREELVAARAVADERAKTIDVLIAQVTELRTLLADALATTRLLAVGGGRTGG